MAQVGNFELLARVGTLGKNAVWRVRCLSCGTVVDLRRDVLTKQRSCGCLTAKLSAAAHTKHGQYGTPEYMAWVSMIQRCTNPKHRKFPLYGGRGIRVCDEWRGGFSAFFDHIGARPSDGHSLDRIDSDGNYEPGNVRWATIEVQNRNRRLPQRRAS